MLYTALCLFLELVVVAIVGQAQVVTWFFRHKTVRTVNSLTSSYMLSFRSKSPAFLGSTWTWTCCNQTNKRRQGVRWGSLSRDTLSPRRDWCDRAAFHGESLPLHRTLEKSERSTAAMSQTTRGWLCISKQATRTPQRLVIFTLILVTPPPPLSVVNLSAITNYVICTVNFDILLCMVDMVMSLRYCFIWGDTHTNWKHSAKQKHLSIDLKDIGS